MRVDGWMLGGALVKRPWPGAKTRARGPFGLERSQAVVFPEAVPEAVPEVVSRFESGRVGS